MPVYSPGYERGRPETWEVQRRPDQRRRARRMARLNEQKPCSVPGCGQNRKGNSRYCNKHDQLARLTGDPIATLPHPRELDVIKYAVAYLSHLPASAGGASGDRVTEALREEARRHLVPVSWYTRTPPPRITSRGKAAIIKAGAVRNGADFTDWLRHALALSAWVELFYDGLPENRQRFLETQIGAWLSTRGAPRKLKVKRGKLPTGTEPTVPAFSLGLPRRQLGKEALASITRSPVLRSVWSTDMADGDGNIVDLLGVTARALEALGLHRPQHHTHRNTRN